MAKPSSNALRVLVVEDHEDARDMYAAALEMAGCEVRTAADADSGFAIAAEWLPDVIVTDFLLRPGPNGAELCRRVHDDPRTAHIPTLVMTGSTRKSDAEAILGAGCADIRMKPYLPDALIEDVRRLADSAIANRRTA